MIFTENKVIDEAFSEKARALRPFYFIVVVWGKRYTDFLCNFCIPSLLSPNNIPALLNSGNKFLIATTDEDWADIQTRPIFNLLKQYVEPVFIQIPPWNEEVHSVFHMGIGHKLATHRAFEDKAFGAILTPDLMVSDGTIAALQRHAVNGVEVVLTAALRFGEEPLFEHLEQIGIASPDSRFGDEGKPLTVTGRQLVWAGIRSFHSQTLCYEWSAPHFTTCFVVAVWWRVPDEDGIIVHSGSWAPFLIDYAALKDHDSSVMDKWTIDGDYIHSNFGVDSKLHVVQDSDEMILVSWASLSDGAVPLESRPHYMKRFSGEWEKGVLLYETLIHEAYDPLKRQIFTRPVYWHAREINQEKWSATEKRALHIIKKYGLHETITGTLTYFAPKALERLRHIKLCLSRIGGHIRYPFAAAIYYWGVRRHALNLINEALRGNPAAKRRVKRSFLVVINGLIGRPIRLDK